MIEITTDTKRKIGCIAVVLLALNALFFTKGILSSMLSFKLVGNWDVLTIVGILAIAFVYMVWKRDI